MVRLQNNLLYLWLSFDDYLWKQLINIYYERGTIQKNSCRE